MMDFFIDLRQTLDRISYKRGDETIMAHDAMLFILELLRVVNNAGGKIIFIGNGGSAAIASHMAIDWTKNGGYRALCFNDAAFLTCLTNDIGFIQSFALPVHRFGESGDVLFAISSSGESPNILEAARTARDKNMTVITLSGFNAANKLRKMGHYNLYASSMDYGVVECAHLAVIHSMLNKAMANA